MPDLGTYSGTVLGAYGVTLALVILLVVQSALRGVQVRRRLAQVEREQGEGRDGRA